MSTTTITTVTQERAAAEASHWAELRARIDPVANLAALDTDSLRVVQAMHADLADGPDAFERPEHRAQARIMAGEARRVLVSRHAPDADGLYGCSSDATTCLCATPEV